MSWTRTARVVAGAAGLGVVVGLAGCAGKDMGRAPGAPEAVPRQASLEEYEALLADNEAALRARGVDLDRQAGGAGKAAPASAAAEEAPAGADEDFAGAVSEAPAEPVDMVEAEAAPARDMESPEGPSRAERKAAERCDQVCDLAASTCEIADRICELAREHEGEPRYSDACTRAERHCAIAQEACLACAE